MEHAINFELPIAKSVKVSDALMAGDDDRFGDRNAIQNHIKEHGDAVLYTAYRDVLPALNGVDDMGKESDWSWYTDFVVYSGANFGPENPCRSIGHWNPSSQYEVFQVVNGSVLIFVTVSEGAENGWWHVVHEKQIVEIPPGAWHLTIAPFGPASVLNIYSGNSVVDSTARADSQKYTSRQALAVRIVELGGNLTWHIGDSSFEPKLCQADILHDDNNNEVWLHELVKERNAEFLDRFTDVHGVDANLQSDATVTAKIEIDDQTSIVHLNQQIENIGEALSSVTKKRRVLVLADTVVSNLYGAKITESIKAAGFEFECINFSIPNHQKSLATVESIYETFANLGADSSAVVVLFGGNVLIDCAGYASSTYFRGLDYVVVGTTLLAQTDGALGGTLGVHFQSMTNHVGCRRQPLLVFNAPEVLASLPPAEISAGFAEVIKHSVVVDRALFERLESMRSAAAMQWPNMVDIASDVALRKVELLNGGIDGCLNYGHTFGQALEGITGHKYFRHGEAVAIGMVFANELGCSLGVLDRKLANRINALIKDFGLPTEVSLNFLSELFGDRQTAVEQLLHGISRDKKSFEGAVNWVLPATLGGFVRRRLEPDVISDHLNQYLDHQMANNILELTNV